MVFVSCVEDIHVNVSTVAAESATGKYKPPTLCLIQPNPAGPHATSKYRQVLIVQAEAAASRRRWLSEWFATKIM
jgi:hypothetical protein